MELAITSGRLNTSRGDDQMSRWMMWALMGVVVGALVVAGCGEADSCGGTTADVYARNTVEGGQVVDVHIVPGAPGSLPDTSNHTAQVE